MRSTLVVCVLLCVAASGHAQPDLSPLQRPSRPMMEAAQQHFRSGTRFYEEGSWDAALVEFTASFQLSGERDLLHNISWTHEKAGRTREALAYAERYLSASRGTEDEERAEKRVAFLKERYGGGAAPAVEPVAAQTAQTAASSPKMDVGAAGRAKAAGPCDRAPGGRWSAGAGGSRLLGRGVVDRTAGKRPRADLATTWAVLSRSQVFPFQQKSFVAINRPVSARKWIWHRGGSSAR